MKMIRIIALFCATILVAQAEENYPAPKSLGNVDEYGKNIQRTMRLLTESTPQKRNTVKVLFYGQSITEQAWSKLVADDLKKRFPNANLIIENRAIGGFASQLLVKTAETDLYSFYPDLLIFHVYGSHIEYENIIKRVRQRTTAEILQQTDHINRDDMLAEETDPAKLAPNKWDAWMNNAFLPGISKKYGTELCDQHAIWKQYLKDYSLPAAKLLKDGVHLNPYGEYLMSTIVNAYLRADTKFPKPAADEWVKTYDVGKDAKWNGGKLTIEFDGNRVDLIAKDGTAQPATIRIDGKKPSEFPELYGLTRTTYYPASKWPCLLLVNHEKPLQLEEWTATLKDLSPDYKTFKFSVSGSVTGPDGEGTSTEKFVSKSGRVIINPEDWYLDRCQSVFKRPLPAGDFQVKWKIVPYFVNEYVSPGVKDPAIESVVTVAQGLPNGKHTLEISGDEKTPIAAIRIYRPPLAADAK